MFYAGGRVIRTKLVVDVIAQCRGLHLAAAEPTPAAGTHLLMILQAESVGVYMQHVQEVN